MSRRDAENARAVASREAHSMRTLRSASRALCPGTPRYPRANLDRDILKHPFFEILPIDGDHVLFAVQFPRHESHDTAKLVNRKPPDPFLSERPASVFRRSPAAFLLLLPMLGSGLSHTFRIVRRSIPDPLSSTMIRASRPRSSSRSPAGCDTGSRPRRTHSSPAQKPRYQDRESAHRRARA